MSGFQNYTPDYTTTGRRSGPPIVKIESTPSGTVLRFTAAIRDSFYISKDEKWPNDKEAYIRILVDPQVRTIALVNTTKTHPDAISVRGLSGSAYASAGVLMEKFGIPAGRFEAKREYLDPADTDMAWTIFWGKDLGPGQQRTAQKS